METQIKRKDITELAVEVSLDVAIKDGLSGNSYTVVNKDQPYTVAPPVAHNLEPSNPLLSSETVEPGDYLFCSLEDCLMVGPYGFIYLRDGTLVGESGCTYNNAHVLNNLDFRIRYEKGNVLVQKTPGAVYRATHHHTANYGHTLAQSLGMMRTLDTVSLRDTRMIGHNFGQAFVNDIYAIAGYWNLMSYGGNTLAADQFLFSCMRDISQENLDWVRKKTTEKFETIINGSPSPKRIYLSRKNKRRTLKNETLLSPVLEKHGFVTIEPETFSFLQQVILFSQAETIIGPYGAALCNSVFMKPGGIVVEICSPEWETDGWFRKFAACSRMGYAKLVGRSLYSPESEISDTLKDFEVDPEVLDQVLSTL